MAKYMKNYKQEILREKEKIEEKNKSILDKINAFLLIHPKQSEKKKDWQEKISKINNNFEIIEKQVDLIQYIQEYYEKEHEMKENYIRQSHVNDLIEKYSDKLVFLSSIEKKYLTNISEKFINDFKYFTSYFEKINRDYVKNELKKHNDFFSNIERKSLDSQQREAIVVNEDNNLVVAGAGSGKTLTIVGKVEYLVKKKNVHPQNILLLSFNKSAANQMKYRIKDKLKMDVDVSTFHSFGLKILRKKYPNLQVEANLDKYVEKFFKQMDNDLIKDFLTFIGQYSYISKDFNNFEILGEYYQYFGNINLQTLKGMILDLDEDNTTNTNNRKINDVEDFFEEDSKRSFKGETVKSIEELKIANFLFLNGVNYEYEKKYPDETGKCGWYKPDFTITNSNGEKIYLEHFAITKEGNTPPFFNEADAKKYKVDMNTKRTLHAENGTTLIETYSYYEFEGILIEKLSALLAKNNVVFKPLSESELIQHLNKIKTRYDFLQLIEIFKTFLNLFKANNYSKKDLELFKKESSKITIPFHRERENLFFKIFEPLYDFYEYELHKNSAIDFSDMIIKAVDEIDEDNIFYSHIIVDEYQDTSIARYKLLKKIKEVKNPSIFAVGDDWQSIYRFTGSDLDMFINFENYFGKTYKTKIENTYRNAQELLDVVGDFITANPHQIKKYLKSNKIILDSKKEYENLEKSKNLEKNDSNSHIHSSKLIEDEKNYEEYFKYPVLVFKYYKNKIETLIHSLNFLNRKGSKDIVLLGRFNFDIRFIRESSFFKVVDQKKYIEITYKALPNLSIKFYTIHKAKGLEADDIVLINNTSSIYGFPSQRSDDNLLRYVLTDKDNYDYAEERRLFYVALTRTKNHCILLTDFVNPSSFSDEISLMKNVFVEDLHEVDIISCPKCKTGNIIEREGPRGVFLSCTNYPQCDFSSDFESKKLIEKNVKCPRCGSQLVVRTRNRANSYGSAGSKFLGCSSYPGCTHIENIKDEYLN